VFRKLIYLSLKALSYWYLQSVGIAFYKQPQLDLCAPSNLMSFVGAFDSINIYCSWFNMKSFRLMNHWVQWKSGHFWTSWKKISFSKRVTFHLFVYMQ